MISNRIGVIIPAVLLSVLATSCVQLPKEVDAPAPDGPALTNETFRSWWDDTDPQVDKFFSENEAEHLEGVFTGLQLDFWQQLSGYQDDIDEPWEFTDAPADASKGWKVHATERGHYPQHAVLTKDDPDDKSDSLVFYLTRPDAGSAWFEAFEFQGDLGGRRPATKQGRPRLIARTDTERQVNGLTAAEVRTTLAQALDRGSTRRFTGKEALRTARDWAEPDKQKHGRMSVSVGAASESYSVPTSDGGRITMGMLRLGRTTIMDEGWYYYFDGDDEKLLPAKGYSSYTRHVLMPFAVYVPPKGRLVLLDVSPSEIGLTGVEYDFDA